MNRLSFSAILLAFAAAAIPFFSPATIAAPMQSTPWPKSFEGRPITRIAPAPADRFLARQFPGQVARFNDGRRQIVLRRVTAATRALHPASDCFRAIGYSIEPVAMRIAPDGKPASCFTATRDGRTVIACEQVRGANGDEAWPDVSSWYWAALLGRSAGPWTASLTVEQAPLTQATPE